MRIAIFGAGGVGGYFGGRWAEAGLDVTLIARGTHLAAISDRGLAIKSPLGDATVAVDATDDPASVGPVDAVIVAVKTWQLPHAVEEVKSLIDDDTLTVGMQNGVEAADALTTGLGRGHVLGGSCRIISYIDAPGVIRHLGAEPTVLFGELTGGRSEWVEDLCAELGRGSGMTVIASDDIESVIWSKFHFLAATAGVGSVTQADLGTMRSTTEVRELLRQAMDEILEVGRARGVALADDLTDQALVFLDGLPSDGTSSMQRDFADGKRSELESLSGAVVRLGRDAGIETPVHSFLYAALLPQELEARQRTEEER